eukprot:g1908.t1
MAACAGAQNVSLVPLPGCTKLVAKKICYQGSNKTISTILKSDPLSCKPPTGAKFNNGTCASAGFTDYKGNDPIFRQAELWGQHKVSPATARTAAARSPPNIVFILADDLGYNELNFNNRTRGILTPNLDALADAGVVLDNYYVQPICSPTRSALMTGRYTVRLGTQSNVVYWDTPWGVSLNETFLPQNLQDANYETAMFGKWHLGMFKEAYTPMQRGFEHHMGYYQGCESAWTHVAACCHAGSPTADQNYTCAPGMWGSKDYRGYDWFKSDASKGISVPDTTANNTNSADLIRDAAVSFLEDRAKNGATRPFFLYLPFQNIHGPYTTQQKYFDMYDNSSHAFSPGEQTMFGYLTEMDDAVGHIIATLKSTAQYENSVIVFSSDNGAPPASADVNHQRGSNPGWIARNYPFRGHKGLIWEGGVRVAGFVHSPNAAVLPASARGARYNGLMHLTDWLPTLAGLAGASTERNLPLDGHDQWQAISAAGATNAHASQVVASPRTEMLYGINPLVGGQAGPPKAGLRMGDFKLLTWGYRIKGIEGATRTEPLNAGANESNADPEFVKGPVLYNLKKDPSETTNVATANPSVVKNMLARLKTLAQESVYPMSWEKPYQGPDYFCADCPLRPSAGVDKPWTAWL